MSIRMKKSKREGRIYLIVQITRADRAALKRAAKARKRSVSAHVRAKLGLLA